MLLALVCLMSGCTASVHPLLTSKELLEDSDLSGSWELVSSRPGSEKDRVLLRFEKHDPSTYDVHLLSREADSEALECKRRAGWPDAWTLQVGRIDERLFAQMRPRDLPIGPPLIHGIPVYVFGCIELEPDTIRYFALNDPNCASLAEKANLQHIRYEPSDFVELTVFTMSTKELQKAVISHATEAFNAEPFVLRRIESDAINHP